MPYPYTLMPDGQTLEPVDVVKPPAETQEKSTPTHSPFLDFVNPPPPSSPPASSPPPPPSPPSENNPVFNKHRAEEHVDGARETRDSVRDKGSGRSNLVISEESPAERIPDIGEAQTENDPDADEEQLTGTTSEAYIDLLHMADHLRLMGRAYRDSSPDALHVVRDGLLRPFTYSTVFRHLPTCRESLEFIYADPLDIDDCPVIAFGQRLWQGHNGASGGGSGDTPSDAEQAFTLDDVRQFTEIDAESSDHKKAADYENMLEAVFGYEIEFDDEVYNYSDADKIRQLQNLAKANVHIVDYLDHVIETKQNQDPNITGLSVYRRHFGQTNAGPLRVLLGEDNLLAEVFGLEPEEADEAKYLGNVPLKASASGEELEKIYLGSEVNIATITHEFLHVLDRNTDITQDIVDHWVHKTGVPPDEDIYKFAIKGFAAKQTVFAELWADVGMTAVLDPAVSDVREPYKVFSVKDTYDPNTGTWLYLEKLQIANVFDCGSIPGACAFREVGWRKTRNASDVRAYMIDLFWDALVMRNGEMWNE